MKSFGEQLQAMRAQKNLSQDELAKALGVHQTTISGIERNERLPSPELLMNLSQYFEIALDKLLDKDAWAASRLMARTARAMTTESEPA